MPFMICNFFYYKCYFCGHVIKYNPKKSSYSLQYERVQETNTIYCQNKTREMIQLTDYIIKQNQILYSKFTYSPHSIFRINLV